jgi:hypothetical protein
MQVVLEIFLIAGAIAQNVVASSLQAWALPWGFPLLVGLFAFYIPLRLRVGGPGGTWATALTWRSKVKWVLGTLAACVLLFALTWLGERYFFYGTVRLDATELRAYPGEILEIPGRNFALVNPKINLARMEVNGTSTELPVVEVADGTPQRLRVAMPDPLPAEKATLVVDEPLSSSLLSNRATAQLNALGAPSVSAVEPAVAYRKSDVRIHGNNFDTRTDPQQRFKTTVWIGGASATVTRIDPCKPGPSCLTVRVPEAAMMGPAEIVVTTSVGEKKAQMRILGAPRLDALSPLTAFPHKDGFVDSIITVSGEEFDPEKDRKDMRVYVADTGARSEARILPDARARALSSRWRCLPAARAGT